MKTLGGIFLIPCLTFTPFCKGQEEAGAYSLVISEIMADPRPTVGLPDAEYLEIYNRGTSPVSLAGYRLLFGDKLKYYHPVEVVPTPTGWCLRRENISLFVMRKMSRLLNQRGKHFP